MSNKLAVLVYGLQMVAAVRLCYSEPPVCPLGGVTPASVFVLLLCIAYVLMCCDYDCNVHWHSCSQPSETAA